MIQPANRDSATLEVPNATLVYECLGEGPVVIAAHGMLASVASEHRLGFDWTPIAAAGRKLVRYDARGHGRSSGRPVPADYTWASLAADLLALQRQIAGDTPVDALGASMGCGTVLNAAVQRPLAFRRLVLVIPPTAWETRVAQQAAYRAAADLVEAHGMQALLSAMKSQPLPPIFAESPPTLAPAIAAEILPSTLRGAAISDLPSRQELATLHHPTLVLAWRGDPTHPESTASAIAEILPNAELSIASSLAEVRAWGQRASDFLAATC